MWFLSSDNDTRQDKNNDVYSKVLDRTAGMAGDARSQRLANQHGLEVLDITWEDTGRSKGSCVGPNISDMTIQVQHDGVLTCMPSTTPA